jgi:hypothetical protein
LPRWLLPPPSVQPPAQPAEHTRKGVDIYFRYIFLSQIYLNFHLSKILEDKKVTSSSMGFSSLNRVSARSKPSFRSSWHQVCRIK